MAKLNIKTALTGGTLSCLDRNTPSMTVNGSVCWVMVSGILLCYKYDSSSLATVDEVNVIIPYGNSAGTAGRWILYPTKYLSNPQSPDSFTFTSDDKGVVFSDGSVLKRSAGQGVRFYPSNDNYPLQIFNAEGDALQFTTKPPTNNDALAGTSTTEPITPANLDYVFDSRVGTANAADVKTALNASGSAPIYPFRAWVNFNGVGTVAIRANGNVSSITDNGVGDYTVNFATSLPDTNYAVLTGAESESAYPAEIRSASVRYNTRGTGAVRMNTGKDGNSSFDLYGVFVGIIR